jgi:hypothetical protein
MKRVPRFAAGALAVLVAFAFAACGGGGGGGGNDQDQELSPLTMIDMNVGGTDGVALNQILRIEFSATIDPESVTPETIRIRLSPANAKQVDGVYQVDGNTVEFFPRLPVKDNYSDAGFQPGATYQVKMPGWPTPKTLVTRDGDPLAGEITTTFSCASAGGSMFIDYDPGPPSVVSVNPKDGAQNVAQSITVELTFDEPLDPATATNSNIQLVMTHRPPTNLLADEYPFPGKVMLTQSMESTVIQYVPDFPLADDAKYALRVSYRVTDLVGNDCHPIETTFTIRDEPPQEGEFVLDFGPGSDQYEDEKETVASWNTDLPGTLCGIFTAGAGTGVDGDFRPAASRELATGDWEYDPDGDGEFHFRSFVIESGVTVTLRGDRPAKIFSLKSMEIDGTLDASGVKGGNSETTTSNSAMPAGSGGAGGPGGGDGGDASTRGPTTFANGATEWAGEDGEDGYGTTDTGGETGGWSYYRYSYASGSYYYGYTYAAGAGGGGGANKQDGDDGQNAQNYGGKGGAGGLGGYDYDASNPDDVNGAGGGGSGSRGQYLYFNSSYGSGLYYQYNNAAAGGGGGGGGLVLRSANYIYIRNGGQILADGGDGGNGVAPYYYCGAAGGGGGGGSINAKAARDILLSGAIVSAVGGKGGTKSSTSYYYGAGGDGGDGWIHMGDSSGGPSGSGTISPSSYGRSTWLPKGQGAPTRGQTVWINLGVFDAEFGEVVDGEDLKTWVWTDDLNDPNAKDGQTVTCEIQMAPEDVQNIGFPNETKASAWTPIKDVATLNGKAYKFMRIRFTFEMAYDQELDDPVPYADYLRLRFRY